MTAQLWDVQLAKAWGGSAPAFALDLAFATDATRLVLCGPSGAGKSVTLQALAGLLRPDRGRVALHGEALFDDRADIDWSPQRRGLAYVFQDYALFPHLNVRQNIGFGLLRSGWRNPPRDGGNAAVDQALHDFELDPVAAALPHTLSGGQRQRVALARALAMQPRALLLDEPFAALDAALRERLRDLLDRQLARRAVPLLLVTHDEADIERFGASVLTLDNGRIVNAR
jgi:molybdate transport system ATP-binding protein